MSAPKPRPPAASVVTTTEFVLPNDTNPRGALFGGRFMQWIDITAALAAMKHAGQPCVTASVDEINFLRPIRLGQVVTFTAKVTRAFRTSLEVWVHARCSTAHFTEAFDAGDAYLTFVAVGPDDQPVPVAPVAPESAEERREFAAAALRREHRLAIRESLRQLRAAAPDGEPK